ncbi:MAG: hypothetical protein HYZ29_23515 [Myxococcales bacterium]|nr:hypothetical protein [Myxococcales bacterium]
MTEPVVLRVHRPYADEDAYLAAEAWSVDDKAVLLIEQPALPKDTVVRFEIVLDDGSRPIRAEGKVYKLVAAEGERPGGLRVRFRRFDAATKRFIDRVMAERRKERRSRRPPPSELTPLVLDPEGSAVIARGETATAAPEQSAPEQNAPEQSAPEQSAPEVISAPLSAPAPRLRPDDPGPRAVAAPPNRDELLARLRARRT